MPRAIKLLLLGVALLTACSTAPTLDESAARVKTDLFLSTSITAPESAYAMTSARFQAAMAFSEFTKYATENFTDYVNFTVTGLEYQQGVGINAAKVDGNLLYSGLTTKNASFIWSYDTDKQDWFLDAMRFN